MQHITLNDGTTMPQLGFGVWQISDEDTYPAVTKALETGYRSIDTASMYGNEPGVGRAIRDSGLSREDVFITTKLWNSDHGRDRPRRAVETSLERLGTDYVDLYLIHWPVPAAGKYVETWKALEEIHASGLARTIGVSNFTEETLARLLDGASVVPAVNQIELHPHFTQTAMREINAVHGIATEAWSPLGRGKVLTDPVLTDLARQHGRTPAQIVLRWHIQLGNIVIPKSATPARIEENFDVFSFTLDDEEMARISALDRGQRTGPDPATMG